MFIYKVEFYIGDEFWELNIDIEFILFSLGMHYFIHIEVDVNEYFWLENLLFQYVLQI